MRYEDLILTSRSLYDRLSSLIVEDWSSWSGRRQGTSVVTDQPIEVLEGICKGLRAKVPTCERTCSAIDRSRLDDLFDEAHRKRNTSKQMIISSSATLRTSAEDSFALDNFESIRPRGLPRLLESLRETVPPSLGDIDRSFEVRL